MSNMRSLSFANRDFADGENSPLYRQFVCNFEVRERDISTTLIVQATGYDQPTLITDLHVC